MFRTWRVSLAVAGAAFGGLLCFGIMTRLVFPDLGRYLRRFLHPVLWGLLPFLVPAISCWLGAIIGGMLDRLRESSED